MMRTPTSPCGWRPLRRLLHKLLTSYYQPWFATEERWRENGGGGRILECNSYCYGTPLALSTPAESIYTDKPTRTKSQGIPTVANHPIPTSTHRISSILTKERGRLTNDDLGKDVRIPPHTPLPLSHPYPHSVLRTLLLQSLNWIGIIRLTLHFFQQR